MKFVLLVFSLLVLSITLSLVLVVPTTVLAESKRPVIVQPSENEINLRRLQKDRWDKKNEAYQRKIDCIIEMSNYNGSGWNWYWQRFGK